jgi:hypothetical protein
MIHRTTKHLLIPMLALGMTLGMAAAGSAQAASASLQINFGSAPHFVSVPGTQVREIRQGDRTDYDMFQYGRSYYAYNNANGRWYTSRRSRGRFYMIDDRSVPRELRRIPRDHWRNYPTAWDNGYDRRSGGTSGTFQVNFGGPTHWGGIYGTTVETVPMAERPNYDVFRYGGTYYAYNNNRWYSSPRERGGFTMIEDRSVPTELSKVPREQWHNYPAAWGNQNQTPASNGNGHDNGNGNGRGNSKDRGNQQGNGRGH